MSPHRKQNQFLVLTYFVDICAIIASVCIAYFFRFSLGILPMEKGQPHFVEYLYTLLVVIPVYLAFFRAYGLYQTARYIRRIEEIFLVIKSVTFAIVLLLSLTFFYRGFSYSRLYLVMLWFFSITVLCLARYYLIQYEYFRKKQLKDLTRVLLIGANRNARNIIKWAQTNPHYGRSVIGVLVNEKELIGKHFEGVEVIGVVDACEDFIRKMSPDEVILLETNFTRKRITDLVALCEDLFIEFRLGADFYGLMTRNVHVEYISSVPLLGFKQLPLDDPIHRFLKRVFDFVVSGLMLLTLLPLMLVITIAIKLSDKGPIFYSQERMGRDQKLFNVYKFRTMKVNAESETGPVWAKAEDNRRTKVGNFLRRSNLDELPQLWNVLKGDMSLVGPRPERPHFIEQFREQIPRYMARHKIKSGLTGWAQVNGYRGNTSIGERIKYDLYYMENWSLLFDIEILFMTFSSRSFKNAY